MIGKTQPHFEILTPAGQEHEHQKRNMKQRRCWNLRIAMSAFLLLSETFKKKLDFIEA
ncbi:Pre-Mrna Cleavage Complex 2 Protein Pcf11 [Manis pentadactyla]|nr:Pre-Mrna Cleavage Complex 2 Protein Pcf11 [Manis pentadactyla]